MYITASDLRCTYTSWLPSQNNKQTPMQPYADMTQLTCSSSNQQRIVSCLLQHPQISLIFFYGSLFLFFFLSDALIWWIVVDYATSASWMKSSYHLEFITSLSVIITMYLQQCTGNFIVSNVSSLGYNPPTSYHICCKQTKIKCLPTIRDHYTYFYQMHTLPARV